MGMTDEPRIPEEVVSSCRTLAARDGASLCFRTWLPAEPSQVRRVAILAHGIGLHSEPYSVLGRPLAASGVAV